MIFRDYFDVLTMTLEFFIWIMFKSVSFFIVTKQSTILKNIKAKLKLEIIILNTFDSKFCQSKRSQTLTPFLSILAE